MSLKYIYFCKPSASILFVLLILTGVLLSNFAHAVTRSLGSPGTTITVTTTADRPLVLPGQPYPCTLRHAIEAANTNAKVGGCPAGQRPRWRSASPLRIDYVDRIEFDLGAGTPTIKLLAELPVITEAVDIDGSTGGATRVELNGVRIVHLLTNPPNGLVITDRATSVGSMVINNFAGNGILITDMDEDGRPLPPPDDPQIDVPGVPDDPNGPCGPESYPRDPDCPPGEGDGGPEIPPISSGGGGSHYLANNLIGTDATGRVAVGNNLGRGNQAGIVVLNNGNVIGGSDKKQGNVVAGNRSHGIILSGVNNEVIGNAIGTNFDMDVGLSNGIDGVRVLGEPLAQARCFVGENVIAYNLGNGIFGVHNACGVVANRISDNDLLGIDWAMPGVTLNDPAGLRLRPPNTPVLSHIRYAFVNGGIESQVHGRVSQRTSSDILVELYHNSACDASRYGEGETLKGMTVINGGGSFVITISGFVSSSNLSATATLLDSFGVGRNTSEFSECVSLISR